MQALLSQWVKEIHKTAGSNLVVDVYNHETMKFERRSNHAESIEADIVLTTYKALEKKKNETKAVKKITDVYWARVVLDEMQEIRSNTTSISKNCNSLLAERRWMLSGTPLFEGFGDFRGELCFLRLSPFSFDTEDGFFNFAITQHLEARSRLGLETLRVLSLLLLRRSKSMIIRKTGLPLLGLKPIKITFKPTPQEESERAIYCFLEHLKHTVLGGTATKTKARARSGNESFVRILGEACASVHLLNGGFGCSSQLPLLDRWMKSYNKSSIQERFIGAEGDQEIYTCDEAIQFISQAEGQVNTRENFVTDLRVTAGGGVSSRNRANVLDNTEETLKEVKDQYNICKTSVHINLRKRAKMRWQKCLELITSGELPDEEYASVNKFYSFLWKARRSTPDSSRRGWRPWNVAGVPEKFRWGSPNALLISSIPNCVEKEDILFSLEKKTSGTIGLFSNGPSTQNELWKGLALHRNARDILNAVDSKNGLPVFSEAAVPHIDEELERATARFNQAEALAIVHQSGRNSLRREKAESDLTVARRGLRAYTEYKVGHVHIERAFQGFRSENRPRKDFIVELDKEIENSNNQIQNSRKEMQRLSEEMERVTNRITNNVSAKVQGMTSVEALQALQIGNKEKTMCTICLEHLGHSDRDGLVTVFQCSHLMCRHCFLELENSKKERGERLTCGECRKLITSTIIVDPSKAEDEEAVNERKNSAKRLVQKAAKMVGNGNGILNPELWEALYHSIEVQPGLDVSRDRQFPGIAGDLLGHIRNATKMKPNSTPKCRSENPEAILSSKFRALLRDLPKRRAKCSLYEF